MAVRDAEVAAVGDPRGARARGPRLGRRIGQRTLDRRVGSEIDRLLAVIAGLGRQLARRERGGACGRAQPVAADAPIAGLEIRSVGVEQERSEERRVGKDWVSRCRSRWATNHYIKTHL